MDFRCPFMNDRREVAPPLAAIMALTELIEKSSGAMFPAYITHLAYVGVPSSCTMFELSGVLDRAPSSSMTVFLTHKPERWCELFNLFVTVAHILGVRVFPSLADTQHHTVLLRASLTSRTNLFGRGISTLQRPHCTVRKIAGLPMDSPRMDQCMAFSCTLKPSLFSHINVVLRQI